MTNLVGQQFGKYRLTRFLDDGGFAEVYLGKHEELGTEAAIKVLKTSLPQTEEKKFRNEATTIANLIHPHIVRVFDFGVRGNSPFMVMDYAPNGTLRQLHPSGSQVSLHIIASYVKQIAEALQYAHDAKIIHRDVKPANMLIGRLNEIWLSDFGIAVLAHSTHSMIIQDKVGTLAYMAPEQLQGKPTVASDQYALGIVVYEWICGELPFMGTDLEILTQHLSVMPTSLRVKVPTISSNIEQVVLKALSKDPQQRFTSVQEFAQALEQASQPGQIATIVLSPNSPPSQGIAPTQPAVLPPPLGTLLYTYRGHEGVTSVSWSYNGQYVASRNRNNSVHVWDATTGNTIFTYPNSSTQSSPTFLKRLLSPPTSSVNAINWSPTQLHIAIVSTIKETMVEVWDVIRKIKVGVNQVSNRVESITWSPDGKYLLIRSLSQIVIWDISTNNFVYDTNHFTIVTWSPDSQQVAFARESDVRTWNIAGKIVTYFHQYQVTALTWSPDGKFIATGSSDNKVRIWDVNNGNCLFIYQGHTAHLTAMAWSPDGIHIASADFAKLSTRPSSPYSRASNKDAFTIQVWNTSTGKALNSFTDYPETHYAYDITWFADSQQIFFRANKAYIWNAFSSKLVFQHHNAFTVGLSANLMRAAYVQGDRTLHIWDANSGDRILTYLDHGIFVWSPDGTRIASIALDGIVRVWQAV